MSENYLCIHGHFYQPPRENPWLEEIEYQPSASPYHDWNERVTRECYGPNTRARLEADGGKILKLLNNYASMSFDFGPTLLSWLERTHPWIYREILAADRESRRRYHGHGNAMAQVYNHIIMPLATIRDKQTQIRWGLADFARRFDRPAEGMWLAETAVDSESLALMAEEGVRFTVLAPTQAGAIRALGGGSAETWKDVSGGKIDTTRAYRVFPRGGQSPFIDVFFFDRELSKAVAYDKILASGSDFLARLEKGNEAEREGARLVNIATDGESYGHHFKFGDMALAWLFDHLAQQGELTLTNYACFLEQFPPEEEVRILEKTSWSCAHGVERWRSDCGCNVNQLEGWNQAWRAPLREAMDWLSGELAGILKEQGERLFKDPWAARDEYILVLLDPSPENRDRFLERHLIKGLDQGERVEAFELMESQRMALYMYTSCGWFFDDIAGLEARQVLMYADRAMNLVRRWSRSDLETSFLSIISKARSNDPAFGDGAAVFDELVKKRRMPASRITANHVFARLFHGGHEEGFFRGRVEPVEEKDDRYSESGEATGEILVSDPMTGKREKISFSARGISPADFECHVRSEGGGEIYTFHDIAPSTMKMLMKSTARNMMDQVSRSASEQDLRFLFSLSPPSEEISGEIKEPLPDGLEDILRIFLRVRILGFPETPKAISREVNVIREVIRNVSGWDCSLQVDDPETRVRSKELVNGMMHQIGAGAETAVMRVLTQFLDMADALSLKMDLWECQNYYWDLSTAEAFTERLSPEQAKAYKKLGKRLGFLI